ncbi:MAG: DUF3109 family protein [Vicingaceae bacterium]
MIQIKDTVISELLLERKFVCDLNACKGACCVEGDAGAPLEKEEAKLIPEIYSKVKPYMRTEGIKAVEKNGFYTIDDDGEEVTTLIEGKECAYTYIDNGVYKCAFEVAFNNGDINFKKPISCHLFPVRITKYKTFTAVNYAYWDICDNACVLGEQLQVKTYRFLKEPLIRKFGKEWYDELELIDKNLP